MYRVSLFLLLAAAPLGADHYDNGYLLPKGSCPQPYCDYDYYYNPCPYCYPYYSLSDEEYNLDATWPSKGEESFSDQLSNYAR